MNKTDGFANIWLKIEQKDNIPFSQFRLIIVINSAHATKWYTLGLWFCEAGKNWAANPIHLPTKIWGKEERDLKGNLGTYSSSDIRFNWKWNCLSRSHPSDVYPPIPSTRSFRVTIGAMPNKYFRARTHEQWIQFITNNAMINGHWLIEFPRSPSGVLAVITHRANAGIEILSVMWWHPVLVWPIRYFDFLNMINQKTHVFLATKILIEKRWMWDERVFQRLFISLHLCSLHSPFIVFLIH